MCKTRLKTAMSWNSCFCYYFLLSVEMKNTNRKDIQRKVPRYERVGGGVGGSVSRLGNDVYLRVNANSFLTVTHTPTAFFGDRGLRLLRIGLQQMTSIQNFVHKSLFFLIIFLLLLLFKDLILNSTRLHASTKELAIVKIQQIDTALSSQYQKLMFTFIS